MSKNHAPPYANLVIAYLIITKLLPRLESDFGTETANHVRQNLMLFLDDGFMMLDENLITHKELLKYLNNMDENINFTMEVSKKNIAFLDVKVILHKLQNNDSGASLPQYSIETDIYHKPTDTFNYFSFDSCAPRHIARNIPYNLTRRIATIVSCPEKRDIRLAELKLRLISKKDPESLIDDSIKKAKSLDRNILLETSAKPKNNYIVTLVLDYNPRVVDPSSRVRDCCKALSLTENVKNAKNATS